MGWSESAYWTGDILGKYKEVDGVIWAGIWKKDFNTHRIFMKDPELVPLAQNEKDRDNTVAIKTYSKYNQGGLKGIRKMLACIFS